jgi:hypothetical protein
MTGSGEGFHQDVPQTSDPFQAPEQAEGVFSGPSPLGSLDRINPRPGTSGESRSSGPQPAQHPEDGVSVFDDDAEGPIHAMADQSGAVPNISDDGTEVIQSGRAEL